MLWRKEFPFLKLSWLTIKQQCCSEKIAKSIVFILLLHFLCAWFWIVIISLIFRPDLLVYIYPRSDLSVFVWVTLHLTLLKIQAQFYFSYCFPSFLIRLFSFLWLLFAPLYYYRLSLCPHTALSHSFSLLCPLPQYWRRPNCLPSLLPTLDLLPLSWRPCFSGCLVCPVFSVCPSFVTFLRHRLCLGHWDRENII